MTDQPLTPEQPTNYQPAPISEADRKARLAQAVAAQVAYGKRVESQSDYQAVLVSGKPVNHVLHLILTLVSCGFWAIVWIILAIVGGEKRSVMIVDPYGNVLNQ